MERTQTSDSFVLGAMLSFSGGLQDAYTYNIRGSVFANAQTGNVVLMSQNLMLGKFSVAFHYILPLMSFALGVFIAERIESNHKSASKIHWRQIVLLVEIFLLGAVGFLPETLNVLANVFVSFSCAMQVQSFRKVHGFGYASTMCIGNLRSGIESLSQYLRIRDKNLLFRTLHYFGIIFIFAMGSGIGGIASSVMGIHTIWISAALLSMIVVIMKREFI
ncbi:MAG: YoaK family protein [Oscillospiraceae bacterium]|nr:YoaK family protein [Oscillospiraceae bacterium]